MVNEEAFYSALRENPSDEVTWLAMADWFEENDQTQRAELIRIIRQLRRLPVMRRVKPRKTLENRLITLLNTGVKPVVAEITNSIGLRMALIEPGNFRMGSPSSEMDRRPNERSHEVLLTKPFYLSVFLVTRGEYDKVMGTRYSKSEQNGDNDGVPKSERSKCPMGSINWQEAHDFFARLKMRDKKKGISLNYRLASEAEWEYACRAYTSSPFHYGDTLSGTQANFNGDRPYGPVEDGPFINRPCAVGSYPPNAFGLYDMHGNIWEWLNDWYAEYPRSKRHIDPTGPEQGSEKVIRGGCVDDVGESLRSAYRFGVNPEGRYGYLGFRVAADFRVIDLQSNPKSVGTT